MTTTELIESLIDDGMRGYRLKYSVSKCPKFDKEIYVLAWRAGSFGARDHISLKAVLATFIIQHNIVDNPQ